MDAVEFSTKIVTLGLLYRFSVTSWGRSRKHNTAVGGDSNSRHLLFLAVDGVTDEPVDRHLFIDNCARLGLRAIWEEDHWHVQSP